MPYPEFLITPMRDELTSVGVTELRSAEEVDRVVSQPGTTMVIVNSVCGCAAGKARPGIVRAMQHATRPDRSTSVFAGADIEATDRARSHFTGYPPSSPSVAILRDGKLVYMMERHQIEGSSADGIATALTDAFDKYCATPVA